MDPYYVAITTISLAAIYGLLAIGISIIWSSLGMINMAHGFTYAISGYGAWVVAQYINASGVAVVAGGVLTGMLAGALIGAVAFIPLYDDLRAVLAGIPKRSPTILTNSKRRPWTANSLTYAFSMATLTAGLRERKLHFHDLRGTAATKFYLARLPVRVIAEIMAWDEESVERIIRRYVDRSAATRAIIRQLNEGNEK